jgi:hypothetical protein
MTPEDIHRVCRLEKDVAVLNEQGKAVAMALVLAKNLAAAQRIATTALLLSGIGWLLGIIGIAFMALKK